MATSRPGSPTSPRMRSRISLAALLVNVTARICHGRTPLTPIRYAMRCASTRVLPDPAPARMSSGPSVVVTARACSGFRRLTMRSASAAGPSRSPGGATAGRAGPSRPTLATAENQAASSASSPARIGRRCRGTLAPPAWTSARGSGSSSAAASSTPSGSGSGGGGSSGQSKRILVIGRAPTDASRVPVPPRSALGRPSGTGASRVRRSSGRRRSSTRPRPASGWWSNGKPSTGR